MSQFFPRFYFIADRDLLEILTKPAHEVVAHVSSFTDSVQRMVTDKHDVALVVAVAGDKEVVPLPEESRVCVEGAPEEFAAALCAAAAAGVAAAIREALMWTGGFEELFLTAIAQAGVLRAQLLWTGEIEEALRDGSSEAMSKALAATDARMATLVRLNMMSDQELKAKSGYDWLRKKVETQLVLGCHMRDSILALHGCTSPNDFTWLTKQRVYVDNEGIPTVRHHSLLLSPPRSLPYHSLPAS